MQWKWKACWKIISQLGVEDNDVPSVTYIADTPGDGALLGGGRGLVGLAVDAQIHDMVAADGAVVDDDVPRP